MSEPEASRKSWSERLFGGFKKTSERLSENLTTAVTKAKLDDATLDDVEDALIISDLGPSAARRIREKLAEKLNRPVFKVMGDDQLIELARQAPDSWHTLNEAGLSKRQVQIFGQQILGAVKRGKEAPQVERQPFERPSDATIRRIDRLKAWRKKVAAKLEVESDIILPRVYLSSIAEESPRSLEALQAIMKDSPWRFETYGKDILKSIGVKL